MQYLTFRVINYKSFKQSQDALLFHGFNAIVGKNNSGKTAITEALSLKFSNQPHRSVEAMPDRRSKVPSNSEIETTIEIPIEELRSLIYNSNNVFSVPIIPNLSQAAQVENLENLFKEKTAVRVQFSFTPETIKGAFLLPYWNSRQADAYRYKLKAQGDKPELVTNHVASSQQQEDLAYRVASEFMLRIYSFRAERFHVGQSKTSPNVILESDARNLPSVLLNLKSGNTIKFNQFLNHVRDIFPEINDININLISDEEAKIFVSTLEGQETRQDLDIALQDSGTGIGQVLAILYVVTTAIYPQVFIIDEPQSFLHPNAIRKLFDILRKNKPAHQYIITTHSSTALSAADPSNVIHVSKQGAVSNVSNFSLADRDALNSLLNDVGARPSDIFGAEGVIWVEGKTEELCFPLIITDKCENPLRGNVILGIVNKGDLEARKKRSVALTLELYRRLSQSGALMPPAVAFIFDRENLSLQEMEDAIRQSEGKVRFLKRRMYENYLLHPTAILALLESQGFSETDKVQKSIHTWMTSNQWDQDFFQAQITSIEKTEEYWLENVDGASFLNRMIIQITESQYNYDGNKVVYGKFLTHWILQNDATFLDGIAHLLDEVLSET